MTELERYKEALEKMTNGHLSSDRMREIAFHALNPPQEFEEVEVERWLCAQCEGHIRKFGDKCFACGFQGYDQADYIRLLGTYRRPVKQKVKRREEIAWCSTYTRKYSRHENSGNLPIPEGARMFIEWEE